MLSDCDFDPSRIGHAVVVHYGHDAVPCMFDPRVLTDRQPPPSLANVNQLRSALAPGIEYGGGGYRIALVDHDDLRWLTGSL
jgi:hypothetical protein